MSEENLFGLSEEDRNRIGDEIADYGVDAQDHEYQWNDIVRLSIALKENDYDLFKGRFLELDSVPVSVILDCWPALFADATDDQKAELYIAHKLA